jgi:hypothetical protein
MSLALPGALLISWQYFLHEEHLGYMHCFMDNIKNKILSELMSSLKTQIFLYGTSTEKTTLTVVCPGRSCTSVAMIGVQMGEMSKLG